jgi:hypothetical protein
MGDTTNEGGLEDVPPFLENSGMPKIGNFYGFVVVQEDVV